MDNARHESRAPRLVGGLDLGGTKIQAVLLDGRRNVVADAKQATPAEGDGDDVVAALASTLAEVCEKAGVASADLAGVGVGSPGAIDGRRGVVSGARNLPGEGAPIRMVAGLKKLAGTPAYLGNDVSVATHAEFELGAAAEFPSLLGVFWGPGSAVASCSTASSGPAVAPPARSATSS